MSRFPRTAVAVAAVLMLFVNLARASVLDMVPGEALLVVKVTNLKGVSDKIAKFTTELGVAAFAPPLQDPLGFLREQAGIKAGINDAGDMAIVFIDPDATGGNPDKSFVALVPVSDYAGFLGNFADAKTEGDVSEFVPPGAPEPVFAAKWGDYAALCPTREIAAMKPTGLKVAGVSAKELGKDMVLMANFENLRGKLQPHLAEGREKITSSIEQELTRKAPEMAKFGPTLKVAINRVMDIADAFLRDAHASTVAVSFVPEGLNISVVADFNKGTYIGDYFAKNENFTDSFTKGLPQGKYLFFGGYRGAPEHDAKLFEDICRPVIEELKKTDGAESAALDKMYNNFIAYIKAAKGQTAGLLAPPVSADPAGGAGFEFGKDALLRAVNIYTGDVKAMKTAYFGMMECQGELMTAFGLPADQFKYKINKGVRTVEGVTFDEVASDFKLDANNPDTAGAEQMMKFMYGEGGLKFHVGEVGPETMIQVFGLNDAEVAEAIKSAKAWSDPLGDWPGVKAVNAQLPKSKIGAFYVPIDEVVNTGLQVAKQFGLGVNVQMQPDLPPLGFSFATEGTAMRFDTHAPTQLISQLIAAGFQIGMQMNQGPRQGGPRGN